MDLDFNIKCPDCKKISTITSSELATDKHTCPNCNKEITLLDTSDKHTQQELDKLAESLKTLLNYGGYTK